MEIISLAPSNTEILYEIGAEDQIVATTSLCNHPEEAYEKPSIGGWTNPKISRIHEFNPDLILASDNLQNEAVEKIEGEGYPVLQVKPHSLEGIYDSIREIGEAVGKEEEAEKLIDEMKSEIEQIKLGDSPRIYCEEWMDPPMVSGNWIPDLIQEIGGEYFIDDGRSREFDFRDLKDFDPEYIFMHICGAGENLNTDQLTERDGWKDLIAVQKGQVFIVDDDFLNRPGPRLVDGAKKIKELIDG